MNKLSHLKPGNMTKIKNSKEQLKLPTPYKKKRYIFGDFVSFVQKVNMLHRLILIKKSIQNTTKKFNEEIKSKYKSLEKYNIYNFNFSKHIQNIFSEINLNFNYYERNIQGKINIFNFCKATKKYILSYIIKKISIFIESKNKKAILIQSCIRGFIIFKKIKSLKKEMNKKAIYIQKYIRGFLIRKKHKKNLISIIDIISFNKMQKEYERKLKIMLKKRDAIRVIERWWEGILEERRQKELDEKIKRMPKDCQDLFRDFLNMRKQTKDIKKEFRQIKKENFEKFGFS